MKERSAPTGKLLLHALSAGSSFMVSSDLALSAQSSLIGHLV